MTKPINQRNFCISKGELLGVYMDYQIDNQGLENILNGIVQAQFRVAIYFLYPKPLIEKRGAHANTSWRPTVAHLSV